MDGKKYVVAYDGKIHARGLSLDDALLFVKASEETSAWGFFDIFCENKEDRKLPKSTYDQKTMDYLRNRLTSTPNGEERQEILISIAKLMRRD